METGLLNVAQTIAKSASNGPGERYVVWLQGCPLRCEGCWNQSMWPFGKGRSMRSQELVAEVLSTPGVEGLTLTGGEPFAQAGQLVAVARHVREAGLSVMVFTGYEPDELTWPEARDLLAYCDIVITGRFLQALRTFYLPWRGSSNQRVHFLTGRYDEGDTLGAAQYEVHLRADGTMTLTGIPDLRM